VLLHPENRGSIRIRSADPSVHPEMRFNLFVSESDRRVAIKGLRMLRRIMSMPRYPAM
jgi:choline dehydrogenase